MKFFPTALLPASGLVLLAPAVRAAITVTISPGSGGGTVFSVTQTAPNPILSKGFTGRARRIILPVS